MNQKVVFIKNKAFKAALMKPFLRPVKKGLSHRFTRRRLFMALMLFAALCLSSGSSRLFAQSFSNKQIQKGFRQAEKQTKVMLTQMQKTAARHPLSKLVSPRTLESGQLKMVKASDWTSGFFPGELWMLYQYSGKEKWKSAAKKMTRLIEPEQYNGRTHDMGFKVYCSVGRAYQLTHDGHDKAVLIQAAKTLATRFNPKAGVIRSWDHNKDKWAYPVIIDNMMNLELLFAATRLTGDSSYYRIAVSHADKTLEHHFRKDYSSYHVVDYDSTTGGVLQKTTHQGYSNSSAWSRGQGWGLYGFTMCYRETGDPRYLSQAEHIAAFIFNHPHLPKDGVPYWDFDDPAISSDPASVPKDASAAAVIASGLLELSQYSKQGARYLKMAEKILQSLKQHYQAAPGQASGFILLHSTGSRPSDSEVDVPLSYADYYYLEALGRLQQLRKSGKLTINI